MLGPYRLATKDGRTSLALGFAGQLQMELLSEDSGAGDDRETSGLPKLRRIRLLLLGSVLTDRLTYYLQLSTAPKSLEIMDYNLQYRFHRHVRLRVGQYKIPFTSYRDGSFKRLTAVDWSIITSAFGSERQLGLHLHNDDSAPAGVFYAVGIFTGQNARRSHEIWLARTWGETLGNPSDLTDPAPLEAIHPELVARLSYKSGGINVRQDTDFKGGPFRFAVTLGLAWDIRPKLYIDLALRSAAELLVKARGFSLRAGGYLGMAKKDEDAKLRQRFAMLGGLLQASYLIRKRYEVAARYGVIHFDQGLLSDARRRAADLINAETDPDTRAALEEQYKGAGLVKREHEATIGFNWYIIGSNFKIQTDLSWLGHERASGLLNDIRWRTQLQLAF